MKSTLKTGDGILGGVAFACYVFTLAACGIAAYALVTLSLPLYGELGRGLYLLT